MGRSVSVTIIGDVVFDMYVVNSVLYVSVHMFASVTNSYEQDNLTKSI